MIIAGIDGCRGGWVAALQPLAEREAPYEVRVVARIEELTEVAQAAIDMPIGLLAEPAPGGRACDRLARRRLGRRACCVFTPPSRALLDAQSFDEVRGRGLNRQAFSLLPRIRELDRFLTPARQRRFCEAHPELAFQRLLGAPVRHTKRTPRGQRERLAALRLDRVPARPPGAADDDVLDALVLGRVARGIAEGTAQRLPPRPPRDRRGLRMEIWY
ncbi:MAG: DUF429 domain-containing protein [Planctomycetota bacterium]|jgi:predicted RNase H-like nuclease